MDRRDFMKSGAMIAASSLVETQHGIALAFQPRRILVQTKAPSCKHTRLAAQELLSGLRSLHPPTAILQSTGDHLPGDMLLDLTIDPNSFKGDEDYEIRASQNGATLKASNSQALLYSVFDFLERQGIVFGIDGTTIPIDHGPLFLPPVGNPWVSSPSFGVRGLLPWPDFLNCISVYNPEDYRAYFASMLRMRFNMFGMHVYTRNCPGPLAESYLSFEFAGVGHRAALESSTMRNWGYLPQRTSTYKMGAAQYFDQDTFGADATRLGADIWDIAHRTTEMMRSAFQFASELGIKTGIGFEPYNNPVEIDAALPPEAISHPGGLAESRAGRALLESRLADLLERYPMIDYVWLWQDEAHNWAGRNKKVHLPATPFLQAHDFLRRHAPEKKLVLAGWGGVTRHFQSLHQRLPQDIIFSALDDSFGWNPVSEEFSKLDGRERWPIPWLEDDPSMWFPQFRASRVEIDIKRSKSFGCQGMLGIHWRQRIVDPTATYLSRALWDPQLTAAAHYQNFSAAMASGDRKRRLAELFVDCDLRRDISSTFLGTYNQQGYANTVSLAADPGAGFRYSESGEDLAVLPKQMSIAKAFEQLVREAQSPTEKNRIGYFSGFVNFMVPYCEAFEKAHQLGLVLDEAVKLRSAGKEAEAKSYVMQHGVPLWLAIAPLARQVMLDFQAVVATRNDQGQLASMQNKFVRISLERLRLSIQEFVDELSPAIDHAYETATSPEGANSARIFIPTRPSLLNPAESLRLFIVAPGIEDTPAQVMFHTQLEGQTEWRTQTAIHAGRSVYTAQLGPFLSHNRTVRYYASLEREGRRLVDPPEAPGRNFYTANILS
jgi:hypothetical protein